MRESYDQSLPYTIVCFFFITERRTTESTWSACPSILLFFKEKNEGKHMISLSLTPLFLGNFLEQKNEGKHMISLSFHTIIFQRKEWGKAMISLSLILLFFQKQKNDVKHVISLSFHTIIFQRKEWGKAMISLSLILLLLVFFITERRTTESTWSACPSILLYFKEKNEGKSIWSVSR